MTKKGFDAVPFYPAWLYKTPGTPLHFLQQLRDFYIAQYDDPIVQDDKAPHYMAILFVLEVAMQLPVALYAVYRLGLGARRTTGPFELVLLVYALETALSTVLVLHFVYLLDPAEYPQKNVLIFQNYVPWLIARESAATTSRRPIGFERRWRMLTCTIAGLMFVDMFCRLYKRLSTTDIVKKRQ